jgi:hypothetical protein
MHHNAEKFTPRQGYLPGYLFKLKKDGGKQICRESSANRLHSETVMGFEPMLPHHQTHQA